MYHLGVWLVIVKYVLDFIISLENIPSSASYDKEISTKLSNQFKSQDPEKTLNQEDINYITLCLNSRWDKALDHSLDAREGNRLCFQFIKNLATATNKTVVALLMQPAVTNRNTQNNSSEIATPFINLLYILLNYYKQLKTAKGDFSSFKQAADEFESRMGEIDPDYLCHFYSYRINSNNSSAPFLYYFLDIQKANDFTIDKEIDDLSNWLEKYINCFRFIISSITTKFEPRLLNNRTAYVWDIRNYVTQEQGELLLPIYPAIKANNLNQLHQAYERIVSSITVYDPSTYAGFFSFTWRAKSINTWMKHVKDQTLSSTGIEFYPIEVYLKVLGNFKQEANHINKFLDEFIFTCIRKETDLISYIRLHCLFNIMLMKLQANTRSQLLAELKQVDWYQAQIEAESNWVKLIDARILDIGGVSTLTTAQQFTIRHCTEYKRVILHGKTPEHAWFTDSIKGDSKDPVVEKIKSYLVDLNWKTIERIEDVNAHGSLADGSGCSLSDMTDFDYD